MKNLVYDGTFDGLMTAVFEVFEYKFDDVNFYSKDQFQADFFSENFEVITNSEKSTRVLNKIEKNLGKEGIHNLLATFFSEDLNKERLIFSAINQSLKNPHQNIFQNFADDDMLQISKILKSFGRERHRMLAFLRFEKLQDDTYFATIDPDFNVLPFIFKHFEKRYADQKWMIFDARRNYGAYYDLESVQFFNPENDQLQMMRNAKNFHHDEEKHWQKMWQNYFTNTGIASRKNMKLHIQWMPKRYWKYLTEKF